MGKGHKWSLSRHVPANSSLTKTFVFFVYPVWHFVVRKNFKSTRYLNMATVKNFFLLLFVCSCLGASAQFCEQDTVLKSIKEPLALKATIKGYPFLRTLRISKDSLKKNFEIALEDSSYKVVGAYLTYLCEGCNLCLPVYGKLVDTHEYDFLKELKENEFLSFDELVVEKNGKRFKIPSFFIAVTE